MGRRAGEHTRISQAGLAAALVGALVTEAPLQAREPAIVQASLVEYKMECSLSRQTQARTDGRRGRAGGATCTYVAAAAAAAAARVRHFSGRGNRLAQRGEKTELSPSSEQRT